MMHRGCSLAAGLLVILSTPILLKAQGAEEVFKKEYGKKYEKWKQSPDKAGAAAFARDVLLADAKRYGSLMEILCEKAYELGSRDPSGHATAVEAMEFLAENSTDKRADCYEKIAALRRIQFKGARGPDKGSAGETLIEALLDSSRAHLDAGDSAKAVAAAKEASDTAAVVKSGRKDEIKDLLSRLQDRQRTEKKAEDIKKRLREDPKDAASRNELVRLLVVELDNPITAEKYLDETCSEDLRKYVPELAKGTVNAPEADCMDLAGWCEKQAEKASTAGKEAMLTRAMAYLDRFLELHAVTDASRDQAEIAHRRIEEALKGTNPTGQEKWIDLFRGVDFSRDSLEGKWERIGNGLIVSGSRALKRVILPLCPRGSYEFEFQFAVKEGQVDAVFPVGTGSALFDIHGYDANKMSLSNIRGVMGFENGTAVKTPPIEIGHFYTASIRVLLNMDGAQVIVSLDGKPLINWTGPQSEISAHPSWALPEPRFLAIGGTNSVLFQSARLRMLSGKAIPRRPAVPTPGPRQVWSAGQWIDLMKGIDPSRDSVGGGEWLRKANGLAVDARGPSRIILPVIPDGSYECEFQFVINTGVEVDAIFPVGLGALSLYSKNGINKSGLAMIKGKADNETSVDTISYEHGRLYRITIRVLLSNKDCQIIISLDGKPFINWSGPQSVLIAPSWWALPEKRYLGIGAADSQVFFTSARLRMLSGKAIPRIQTESNSQKPAKGR